MLITYTCKYCGTAYFHRSSCGLCEERCKKRLNCIICNKQLSYDPSNRWLENGCQVTIEAGYGSKHDSFSRTNESALHLVICDDCMDKVLERLDKNEEQTK